MNFQQSLSQLKPSFVFMLLALLVGGYIRLFEVLPAEHPINDGGMFFTMTQELISNDFLIPETSGFNSLDIPYAYPPLGFYMAGLLAELTGWELLDIFRVLPAIFTVLSIPAFYFLLRDLLGENDNQILLAVLIFAFLPTTYDWLIMGGGVTRSPAFFFSILTLSSIYRLYRNAQARYIFLTALLATLTVLTHPEAALHTAASALVFFLFFGRNKAGIARSFAVAGIVLLLTAPWWVTVLSRYGFSPFAAAGSTGFYDYRSAMRFLLFNLTHESSPNVIAGLAMIGIFWSLAKKEYFMPVWFIVTYVSEPRSAPLYLAPCIAILAAFALVNLLQIFNQKSTPTTEDAHLFSSPTAKFATGLLFFQWFYSALVLMIVQSNMMSLAAADQLAFDWITTNTPAESSFLVLTGEEPLTDPTSEWFPTLTNRVSVATPQGYEWVANNQFTDLLSEVYDVQLCSFQSPACFESWLQEHRFEVDYVYLRQLFSAVGEEEEAFSSALGPLLQLDERYQLVYQTPEVSIFAVR